MNLLSAQQPAFGETAPPIFSKRRTVRNFLSVSMGMYLEPKPCCRKTGVTRYQFGLCKACLLERFKPLRKIIDEVRG